MQNYNNWPFVRNNMVAPITENNKTNNNMINPSMMNPSMVNPKMMKPGMIPPDMMAPGMMAPGMGNMMPEGAQKDKPSLVEALELIEQAVKGETEDRLFYDYLIRNSPSEVDKEIIKGIRDNEIGHAKMFRQLYYEHTGKVIKPDVNVDFEPPRTYCEGLVKAMIGETNAVIKYRKILFAMQDRRHINTLTEIITDELRHGILYNYLIHRNDCR